MPNLNSDTFEEPVLTELNSPATVEVKRLIAEIEHAQELQYKLIHLETWALVATMDGFIPGFWSCFLENRHTAVKQFLERKRAYKFQASVLASPTSTEILQKVVERSTRSITP